MIKTVALRSPDSRLNRLLLHFVAVLLAAHMLLGCCWHHAHACSAACDAATESCTHQDEHGHTDGDHEHGNLPSHHPTDSCSGERCAFVASPKTTTSGARLATFAAELGPLVNCELPAADRQSSWLHGGVAHLQPSRLHLLYQVLRI